MYTNSQPSFSLSNRNRVVPVDSFSLCPCFQLSTVLRKWRSEFALSVLLSTTSSSGFIILVGTLPSRIFIAVSSVDLGMLFNDASVNALGTGENFCHCLHEQRSVLWKIRKKPEDRNNNYHRCRRVQTTLLAYISSTQNLLPRVQSFYKLTLNASDRKSVVFRVTFLL